MVCILEGLAALEAFHFPHQNYIYWTGGALVTDDGLALKARRLKDFGRSGGGNDIHDSIGYNFKFTELQATVGLEQMKKLTKRYVEKGNIR